MIDDLVFEKRPYYQTLENMGIEIEKEELMTLRQNYLYVIQKNKFKDVKQWGNNTRYPELFDHIVKSMNLKIRDGYESYFEKRDKYDIGPGEFNMLEYEFRSVQYTHDNLILPVDWILGLKYNHHLFDLCIKAMHIISNMYSPVDTDFEQESLWEWIINDYVEPKKDEYSDITKEQFAFAKKWHLATKKTRKSKAEQFIDALNDTEGYKSLLYNKNVGDIDIDEIVEDLTKTVKRIQNPYVKNILYSLIPACLVAKHKHHFIQHYATFYGYDVDDGYPLTVNETCRILFNPFDLYAINVYGNLDSTENQIGCIAPAYHSCLFFPEAEDYFDSGFLEDFFEHMQTLQQSIYEYYESTLRESGECKKWF
jgi:hypothetical protein